MSSQPVHRHHRLFIPVSSCCCSWVVFLSLSKQIWPANLLRRSHTELVAMLSHPASDVQISRKLLQKTPNNFHHLWFQTVTIELLLHHYFSFVPKWQQQPKKNPKQIDDKKRSLTFEAVLLRLPSPTSSKNTSVATRTKIIVSFRLVSRYKTKNVCGAGGSLNQVQQSPPPSSAGTDPPLPTPPLLPPCGSTLTVAKCCREEK